MPYAPGITYDSSPIARGLSSGIADIASALVGRKQKADADKEFQARARAAESFIKTHATDAGIAPEQVKEMLASQPDETPRARYARLTDAISQGIQGATLKRQSEADTRDRELHGLKVDELKRNIRRDAGNSYALGLAFSPQDAGTALQILRSKPGDDLTTPAAPINDPLAAYTQLGGDDPRTLATLAPLAEQLAKGRMPSTKEQPQELTLPSGERVAWSPSTGAFSVLQSAPIPSGYERTPQGLRPVSGGPVDLEQQTLAQKQAEARNQLFAGASNVIDTIDNAMPMVDELTSGFGGTVLNKIPGTKAKDLQEMVGTIKSNVGFDKLQAMRTASPTGGALGQVAVQELKALQASVASLETEQSPAQLKKNLQRVRTHYSNWLRATQGSEKPAAADSPAAMTADDVLGKWLKKK